MNFLKKQLSSRISTKPDHKKSLFQNQKLKNSICSQSIVDILKTDLIQKGECYSYDDYERLNFSTKQQIALKLFAKNHKKRLNWETQVLVHQLSLLSYFDEFDDKRIIHDFVEHLTVEKIDKNQFVFNQNDKSDKFYIIFSGHFGVYHVEKVEKKPTPEEIELQLTKKIQREIQYEDHYILIQQLHTGQQFGEMGLLAKNSKRLATIKAEEDSFVLILNKEDFIQIVGTHEQKKINENIEYLHSLKIFCKLQKKLLQNLYLFKHVVQVNINDKLFIEGQPCDRLFIILKGEIKLIKKINIPKIKNEFYQKNNNKIDMLQKLSTVSTEINKQNQVCLVGQNQTLNELEVFNNLKNYYTAVCNSSSATLLMFHKQDLLYSFKQQQQNFDDILDFGNQIKRTRLDIQQCQREEIFANRSYFVQNKVLKNQNNKFFENYDIQKEELPKFKSITDVNLQDKDNFTIKIQDQLKQENFKTPNKIQLSKQDSNNKISHTQSPKLRKQDSNIKQNEKSPQLQKQLSIQLDETYDRGQSMSKQSPKQNKPVVYKRIHISSKSQIYNKLEANQDEKQSMRQLQQKQIVIDRLLQVEQQINPYIQLDNGIDMIPKISQKQIDKMIFLTKRPSTSNTTSRQGFRPKSVNNSIPNQLAQTDNVGVQILIQKATKGVEINQNILNSSLQKLEDKKNKSRPGSSLPYNIYRIKNQQKKRSNSFQILDD